MAINSKIHTAKVGSTVLVILIGTTLIVCGVRAWAKLNESKVTPEPSQTNTQIQQNENEFILSDEEAQSTKSNEEDFFEEQVNGQEVVLYEKNIGQNGNNEDPKVDTSFPKPDTDYSFRGFVIEIINNEVEHIQYRLQLSNSANGRGADAFTVVAFSPDIVLRKEDDNVLGAMPLYNFRVRFDSNLNIYVVSYANEVEPIYD